MRALGCARAIPAGRSRVRERERVSRGDARVRTRGVRPGSRGVRLADARSRLSFFLSPPRARSTRIARAPLRAESSQKQISSALASYRGSANWETRPGGGEKRKRSSRRSREVRKIRSISRFLFRGWPGQRAAGKSTWEVSRSSVECSRVRLFEFGPFRRRGHTPPPLSARRVPSRPSPWRPPSRTS